MLGGDEILRCREACRLWKHTIDRVSQDEGKLIYFDRIATILRVGNDFNYVNICKESIQTRTLHVGNRLSHGPTSTVSMERGPRHARV